MGENRSSKLARNTTYHISFETERKGLLRTGRIGTIRWELSEILRVQSDSTPKTEFLNIAPEWTFLVSHESGFRYDSISRKTTLIHAEVTELRMPQVTPQNHTRAQKAPGCKVGWKRQLCGARSVVWCREQWAIWGKENWWSIFSQWFVYTSSSRRSYSPYTSNDDFQGQDVKMGCDAQGVRKGKYCIATTICSRHTSQALLLNRFSAMSHSRGGLWTRARVLCHRKLPCELATACELRLSPTQSLTAQCNITTRCNTLFPSLPFPPSSTKKPSRNLFYSLLYLLVNSQDVLKHTSCKKQYWNIK